MKKISVQLLAAAMALLLTACGSGGNTNPETSVQADTAQVSSGQNSIPETTEDSSDTAENTGSISFLTGIGSFSFSGRADNSRFLIKQKCRSIIHF